MAYNATTDFLALIRRTANGARVLQMPGVDYVIAEMSRAGFFNLSVGQTAPTANQPTTVWFRPALQSWSAEGTVFLWNPTTLEYEVATPLLWSIFLTAAIGTVTVEQDVTAGPTVNVLQNAGVVVVNQTVSAPITLNMPLSTAKIGACLISDFKGDAGANPITVQLTGADKFPGGVNTWQIAGNGGSINLRPVNGGYAL